MSKIDFPPDTVLSVQFLKTETRFWEGKKNLVLAYTASKGWMIRDKSGWREVESRHLERLKELISETWNQRVADILAEGGDSLGK